MTTISDHLDPIMQHSRTIHLQRVPRTNPLRTHTSKGRCPVQHSLIVGVWVQHIHTSAPALSRHDDHASALERQPEMCVCRCVCRCV